MRCWDKAASLCEADIGWLLTHQEGEFRFAAGRGLPGSFVAYLHRMEQPRGNEANARLAAGAAFAHIIDMKDAAL